MNGNPSQFTIPPGLPPHPEADGGKCMFKCILGKVGWLNDSQTDENALTVLSIKGLHAFNTLNKHILSSKGLQALVHGLDTN